MNKQEPDHYIDVTNDVCPMTFVKSKLAYERAKPGEIIEIRLRGAEPVSNVPRALDEAGAEMLGGEDAEDGVFLLRVRKAPSAK